MAKVGLENDTLKPPKCPSNWEYSTGQRQLLDIQSGEQMDRVSFSAPRMKVSESSETFLFLSLVLVRLFITFAALYQKITAMREINPQQTTRAYAFEMWMQAPNPMVTFFKTLDVSRLLKISRKSGLKFNMLMCYCIGRAATQIKEFYLLPVGDKLMQYDTIAVNTIVANSAGEVSSCDLPFNEDLAQFNNDYLRLTKQVAESGTDHDLSADSMVIGTSALAQYEIDGAVGMYSGVFNNPFMIWGRYKRGLFKTTLSVSFQFHHTQMDGAHAARFLDLLQREIDKL